MPCAAPCLAYICTDEYCEAVLEFQAQLLIFIVVSLADDGARCVINGATYYLRLSNLTCFVIACLFNSFMYIRYLHVGIYANIGCFAQLDAFDQSDTS